MCVPTRAPMDELAHKVSRERLEEAMERGGVHGALKASTLAHPIVTPPSTGSKAKWSATFTFSTGWAQSLLTHRRYPWAIHFVDLSEHQASSAPATRLRTRGLTGIQNGKSSSPALACHCLETQGPYSEVSAISTHFRNQSPMTKFPSWSRLHPG